MNLENFPESIKKDIGDQSLSILEQINDDVIVIGGWGVSALIDDKHGRYALDIDGVTDVENLWVFCIFTSHQKISRPFQFYSSILL